MQQTSVLKYPAAKLIDVHHIYQRAAAALFGQNTIDDGQGVGAKSFDFDERIFLAESGDQFAVMLGGHAAVKNQCPFLFGIVD